MAQGKQKSYPQQSSEQGARATGCSLCLMHTGCQAEAFNTSKNNLHPRPGSSLKRQCIDLLSVLICLRTGCTALSISFPLSRSRFPSVKSAEMRLKCLRVAATPGLCGFVYFPELFLSLKEAHAFITSSFRSLILISLQRLCRSRVLCGEIFCVTLQVT